MILLLGARDRSSEVEVSLRMVLESHSYIIRLNACKLMQILPSFDASCVL